LAKYKADPTGGLTYLPLLGQRAYVIDGWSHILGAPVRGGKTELAFAAAVEWVNAGHDVLYISEEAEMVWALRIGLSGAQCDWRRLSLFPGLGVNRDDLRALAREVPARIIILDSLANLMETEAEAENDVVMAALINPWIADMRAAGKTLFAVHHTRKGGGENLEAFRGSSSIVACFDVALEMRYVPKAPQRRLLTLKARVIAAPDLVYEMQGRTLRAIGDPKALDLEAVKGRALEKLEDAGDGWFKTSEVRAGLADPQPGEETVRLALLSLAEEGKVERDPPFGKKRSGKASRWRAASA
jgi:predicted ATP-dependent serine protease